MQSGMASATCRKLHLPDQLLERLHGHITGSQLICAAMQFLCDQLRIADILLVLPKNRPLAVCAYANDGHKISVGEEALRAVSISLKRSTAPISETHLFPIENSVDYVEVRLTDSFFARLFDTAGRKSRLAG